MYFLISSSDIRDSFSSSVSFMCQTGQKTVFYNSLSFYKEAEAAPTDLPAIKTCVFNWYFSSASERPPGWGASGEVYILLKPSLLSNALGENKELDCFLDFLENFTKKVDS